MPRRKEKKEISVAAPAFKHKEEELLRDTTGVEELDVLKFLGGWVKVYRA